MTEILEAALDLLTAVAAVTGAVGVLLVNAKVDRFIGRLETPEAAHNAHGNTPELHGR